MFNKRRLPQSVFFGVPAGDEPCSAHDLLLVSAQRTQLDQFRLDADTVKGSTSLQRHSGDVVMHGGTRGALSLLYNVAFD